MKDAKARWGVDDTRIPLARPVALQPMRRINATLGFARTLNAD